VEEIKEFYFKVMGLVILTGLMSCNPQKSDLSSSCGSSEEYSEVVNDCVAVVSSQKADLSISYYYPTNFSTYYKNSTDQISYSIRVENPDDLDFDIKWERIYLGVTYPLSSTELTQNLRPSDYSNSIGDHQIIVKLIYQNNVVASHIFSVSISDLPTPIIDESLTTPKEVRISTNVKSDPINFSLTVLNNSSPIENTEHETRWKVYRNNIIIHQETDPFINISPTDSNTFLLGSNYFDPEILGVGNYKITAEVVKSSMNQVLQKKEWMVSVKPPSLSPVISRNILRTDTSRNFETKIKTYHDIFFDDHLTPVGDFCVEIEEGEGSYTGDNQFVRVDFYLDSSPSPTYSGLTTLTSKKVCLSDGDYSAIKFQNTNPTQIESHSIKARVFDQRQNKEYTQTNMRSGNGTYPIVWNFETHPQNTPPVASFPIELYFECLTISPLARNCTINELQTFKLGFVGSDDFYDPMIDRDKFEYTIQFQRILPTLQNLHTCTKTSLDTGNSNYPGPDFVGPDYECDVLSGIPSYDSNGPIHPVTTLHLATLNFNDTGSPYSGVSLSSPTLTYQFSLNEVNTPPRIDSMSSQITLSSDPSTPITSASEGDQITFSIATEDDERDHRTLKVYLCRNSSCSIKNLIKEVFHQKSNDNLLSTITTSSYTIPFDVVNKDLNVEEIKFLVTLKDHPSTLSSLEANSILIPIAITNINPPPVFLENPNPALVNTPPYPYVENFNNPIQLDAGDVMDTSSVNSENKIGFQWYMDSSGGNNSYTKIPTATSQIIYWKPPLTAQNEDEYNLKVCIHDFTQINPLPPDEEVHTTLEKNNPTSYGVNCRGPWNFRALAKLPNPGPYFDANVNPVPLPSSTTPLSPQVLVGTPFYLHGGLVRDQSADPSEKVVGYQWYVSIGGENNFQKISGADKIYTYWTPPSNATNQTYYLKVCVHDFTAENPLPTDGNVDTTQESTSPSSTGPNCRGPWLLQSISNYKFLNNQNETSENLQDDMAIWVDEGEITTHPSIRVVYSAYADWDGNIYIDKIIYNDDGSINNSSGGGFKTVTFKALKEFVNPLEGKRIKDISITGNEKYLIISYAFDHDGDGEDYKICVRRIDKQHGGNGGSKTNFPHPGKFGFNYDVSELNLESVPSPDYISYPNGDGELTFHGTSRIFYPTEDNNFDLCSLDAFCLVFGIQLNVVSSNNMFVSLDHDHPVNGDYFKMKNSTLFSCTEAECVMNQSTLNNFKDEINNSSNRDFQGFTARTRIHPIYTFLEAYIEGSFGYGDYHPYFDATQTTSKLGQLMIWEMEGEDYLILPYLADSYVNFILKKIDENFNSEVENYYLGAFSGLQNVKNFSNKLFIDPESNTKKIAIYSISDEYENIDGVLTLQNENVAKISVHDNYDVIVVIIIPIPTFTDVNVLNLFDTKPTDPNSISFSTPRKVSYTSGVNHYLSENNHFFALGNVLDSESGESSWKVGRYPNPLDEEGINQEFDLSFISSNRTKSVIHPNNINKIDIETFIKKPVYYSGQPYSSNFTNEARILVNSNYSAGPDGEELDHGYPYALRFSKNNRVSCGECQSLATRNYTISKSAHLTYTPVQSYPTFHVGKQMNNLNADFEAIFSVFPGRHKNELFESDFNRPVFGVYNMGEEPISSKLTNILSDPSGYRTSIIPFTD
jgi:hypothetical protein